MEKVYVATLKLGCKANAMLDAMHVTINSITATVVFL
jgi:hypothetical protein